MKTGSESSVRGPPGIYRLMLATGGGKLASSGTAQAVCHTNSHTGSELVFLCSSGRSPVLADQALDDVGALDPGGHIDRPAGLMHWRSLSARLVGPMFAAVLRAHLVRICQRCCSPWISR